MKGDKEKDQYVTQSDFTAELKSLRADFKEEFLEIKEQMQPLANLDTIIYRNTLKIIFSVLIPLGGVLVYWVHTDLERSQTRIASLEAVNFTPTNEIVLTQIANLLEKQSEKDKPSEKNQKNKSSLKSKNKPRQRLKGR